MPHLDDALQFLITYLRRPRDRNDGQTYGYDIYLPNACSAYAQEAMGVARYDSSTTQTRAREISSVFFDAAWELCRRGILRPTVRHRGGQAVDDGGGYTITAAGQSWLDSGHTVFIPVEPSRTAELLARFRDRLGEGFFQRAQEAVRCWSATAYLSSCVMCGAAAESILLRLAVAKNGDEAHVLSLYRRASGRRAIENLVLQGVPDRLADTFRTLTSLLNYWRDDAAHGTASEVSELEAHEAITRLLRFAQFATDHWDELTSSAR